MREHISSVTRAFIDGLSGVLGNKLYGCCIYGAAAFPDDLPPGDIDFHVILTDPLTDDEKTRLCELHRTLARDFPPLGGEMDGYYLLLADACGSQPPQSQMWGNAIDTSWALHRAHIHAGRCITLHGPEPRGIYPPPTWPEIEQALESELRYVEDHLEQYPHYCILQLCRLIYSYETGDVVISKAQAGFWAGTAFPEWRRHVELAQNAYAGRASPDDIAFMRREVGALLQFCRTRIARGLQQ